MQFLAIFHARPGASMEEFMALRVAEERSVWPRWKDGTIRQMWFRLDSPQPVFLMEAPDADSAQAAIDQLPMVSAALFSVELIALRNFDAMEALFSSNDPSLRDVSASSPQDTLGPHPT